MNDHKAMAPGEFLSARQAVGIPLWVAHFLTMARASGAITLAPRLTAGQRRRAAARTMARGFDAPADQPMADGMFSHLTHANEAAMAPVYAAATVLLPSKRVAPGEHVARWNAAGAAVNAMPNVLPLRAYALMDAISRQAPALWRDMRTQLLANLMGAGVVLDPAERAAFDTVALWASQRVDALQGRIAASSTRTTDYRAIERDPRHTPPVERFL